MKYKLMSENPIQKPIRFTNISIREWQIMRSLKKIGTIRKVDNTEFRLFSLSGTHGKFFDSLSKAQEYALIVF